MGRHERKWGWDESAAEGALSGPFETSFIVHNGSADAHRDHHGPRTGRVHAARSCGFVPSCEVARLVLPERLFDPRRFQPAEFDRQAATVEKQQG